VDRLGSVVDIQHTCYADPDHADALPAVLKGAGTVVSCIDARTQGPDSPIYQGIAAEQIVRAAASAGAKRIVHVSVMGAFRWSYARLSRHAFYLEGGVRNCDAPWAIIRLSCTFDELLEAHVRPPDGGRPLPFHPSSRYSPLSRRDAGRAVLDFIERMSPGRAQCVGGPQVYSGPQLSQLVRPYLTQGNRKTRFLALPRGDVSVAVATTRSVLGYVPQDSFEQALKRDSEDRDRRDPDPAPVYARTKPGPHPGDRGDTPPALARSGPALRRVLHAHLIADLARLGIDEAGLIQLDFTQATLKGRRAKAHDGWMQEMSGVRAHNADGQMIYTGEVTFLRDKLAEEFHVWWCGEGIPQQVWDQLDMGVRRRLAKDKGFRDDTRVATFAAKRHE
jgi:uncharacterized protein YbjT (DUF2867 family)